MNDGDFNARNEELIGRVVASMIDNPREMSLRGFRMIERVNFSVIVGINDYGKVAGKLGSHAKAVRVVAARMGEKVGWQYSFRAIPPTEPGRGEPVKAEPARGFNPAGAAALLCEVLTACLDGEVHVEVGRSQGVGALADFEVFTFTVRPGAIQDEATLLDPFDLGRGETMSLLSALGTIWRAHGRRLGVVFVVGTPGPRA